MSYSKFAAYRLSFPARRKKSLLIKAIRYADPKLQMPMGGRWAEAVIRDFEAWIKMGAPDPREAESNTVASSNKEPYNYNEAQKFWSFQPLK